MWHLLLEIVVFGRVPLCLVFAGSSRALLGVRLIRPRGRRVIDLMTDLPIPIPLEDNFPFLLHFQVYNVSND